MEQISSSLSILGVKGAAQRIFIYLSQNGVSPVSKISESISIPKPSIYDGLSELADLKLVIEYDQGRSKEYGSISAEQLKDLVARKISEIKSAETALLAFIASQDQKNGPVKPKIKFYVGTEGIRQAFRDTMWHEKCTETFLMWPTTEMVDILTPEFSKWHSEQRLKYNVQMYVIRIDSDRALDKSSGAKQELVESKSWTNDIFIRYAPKETQWAMSLWIYDDRCLFASSSGEQFAFVVQSKEFANLMHVLWKNTWEVSKV